MAYDASAYGPWVGGDDWRAWVGVTKTSDTATQCVLKVEAWVWSEYGTTAGYSNIRGGTATGNNSWDRGSATSITTNSWKKLYEKSYTITKTHSSQTVKCWALAEGISGTYSGSSSSVYVNVTVSAKTSYAVTYNANGHGTAPSSQTKWYNESLTLASALSATGYTFKGWNANSSGTGTNYAAGASYTGNAALALYANWKAITYAVTYNANGGSGAPASQTKTYGTNLALSSTRPTRTGYDFLGWATSSSATTATYQPGATYSTNAALSLYAVWRLAYDVPVISGLTIKRCDSGGTEDDEGTYALLGFSWEVDSTDSGEVSSVTYKTRTRGGSWPSSGTSITASGTSGTVSQVIGTFAVSTAYEVQVTVTDSHGMTATATATLSPSFFTLDFLAGGTGVAIGKAATRAGLDVGMYAYFDDAITQTSSAKANFVQKNETYTGKAGTSVPSSDAYLSGRYVKDKDDNILAYTEVARTSADSLNLSWAVRRLLANNTEVTNGLFLRIAANGDRTVAVNDAAPWRTMLDHVDTDWAYLVGSATDTAKRVRYRKKAGIVFVEVWYESSANVGTTATTLATLPSGFRPSLQVETAAFGNANNLAMLRVNPGGSIVAKSMSGTMNYFKGAISFPV